MLAAFAILRGNVITIRQSFEHSSLCPDRSRRPLGGAKGVQERVRRRYNFAQQQSRSKKGPRAAADQFTWPNLNEFAIEVVGESIYQWAVRQHAGDHGVEYALATAVAELVPEDGNKRDASAVLVVVVDGDTVGYLSRQDARSFRRRLGRKGLSDQRTYCAAMIVGGRSMRDGGASATASNWT